MKQVHVSAKRDHLATLAATKQPLTAVAELIWNAADERFKATNARWVFWAVSNELTENAFRLAHQQGRAEWITYQSDDKQITIIAKPWSQIIEDCRARLNFYQEKLRYAADLDSAKEYLQKAHAKYLPAVLQKQDKAS